MEIIDISAKLFSCEVYPGDPEPEKEILESFADGGEYNLSVVRSCVHTGTHVDAPSHFLQFGETIDQLDLERFIGPCYVIEVPPGVITGEYVDNHFPKNCKRLLIKGNGKSFFMDSSAEALTSNGLRLIGTDSVSIGSQENEEGPHKAFFSGGAAVLESLDLSNVKPGKYFLFAPPVCYDSLEAAPARAVLIKK